ncbi:hypothetical protein [Pseudarthrobacter sp. NamB4]|uniref:hypothetical protein n=1 Tax=Pseudarthrobacter sp. NamB4 TaxID=2576837 RepID=UPI0010FED407|nr:hypothetical protein [Pseudarthrobacter sp. NamB4]TLM71688.1 hypothetical protein FDW81_15420 [Pseudarthrobacter sp. NamB4]
MRRTRSSPAPPTGFALWLVFLLVPALLLPSGFPSFAAPSPGEGKQTVLGNDISWPQCSTDFPTGQAFAIIGVNNGLANNTNPCLAEQLRWAEDSAGHPEQPTVSLYVNTANPGAAGSWWPDNDEYPPGRAVHNPYGPCTRGDYGKACAYMYGYARAYDDAYHRGVTNPAGYLWWLDVETENTWSGTDKDANRTVLEGMADFFHSIGAKVGIYSTGQQWEQIVGTVNSSSSLYSLPSWLAGSLNASGAASACSKAPLTGGGRVALTQFVLQGFDYNYPCP